jgi:hypothetical protein
MSQIYDSLLPEDMVPVSRGASPGEMTWETMETINRQTGDARYGLAGVLYLPGVSGNYAVSGDTSALDIVGNIDIRVKVALDDWTPVASATLMAKSVDSDNQTSWRFTLKGTGLPEFRWTTDGAGATLVTANATAAPVVDNGDPLWVRVTLDVDNGAGGNDVVFYTSSDGTSWTQLGTTVTTGTATSIHSGTAPLEIGSRNAGVADLLIGKIYEAQIYDGIAGTLVYNPIFDHPVTEWIIDGANRRDSTGRVTTINGSQWEWQGKA